ncbi:hypothetical protein ACQEU3_40920 [Spirillospora sp. CA-253888]
MLNSTTEELRARVTAPVGEQVAAFPERIGPETGLVDPDLGPPALAGPAVLVEERPGVGVGVGVLGRHMRSEGPSDDTLLLPEAERAGR